MRLFPLAFLLAAVPYLAAAQDAAPPPPGERVFKTQCSMCHAAVPGRTGIGPSLFGILGRPAGTVPDYAYSQANKDAARTWDAATLDAYVADPRKAMPGTKMAYAGLKNEAQRADLITYLATLRGEGS